MKAENPLHLRIFHTARELQKLEEIPAKKVKA